MRDCYSDSMESLVSIQVKTQLAILIGWRTATRIFICSKHSSIPPFSEVAVKEYVKPGMRKDELEKMVEEIARLQYLCSHSNVLNPVLGIVKDYAYFERSCYEWGEG